MKESGSRKIIVYLIVNLGGNQTGNLMCYHLLTQKSKVISRFMVQSVSNLELSNDKVKETSVNFDAYIRPRLN